MGEHDSKVVARVYSFYLQNELEARGLIYKGQHAGWYSVSDETFYPPGQVEARNQDGEEYYISTTSGSRVEWQEEENYKFRLSAFQSALIEHYTAHPEAVQPPQFHADVIKSLQEPLEDLSISRLRSRLSWGIPVPNDPKHTIYVWIDALTCYLSAVDYPWTATSGKGHSVGWPPDVQVIGKDILRYVFTLESFYACILTLGRPLLLQFPRHLFPCDAKSARSAAFTHAPHALSLDSRTHEDVQISRKCCRPCQGNRRDRP